MDLSALIEPILRITAISQHSLKKGSNDGSSNPVSAIATLDRSLGAAATMGLAIILYRLVSSAMRSYYDQSDGNIEFNKKKKLPVSIWALMQILLRGFRLEAGVKRIEDHSVLKKIKDAYFQTVFEEDRNVRDKKEDCKLMQTFGGSCHCRSISFTLKASCNIHARDCKGKIRYPHFLTTADNFQLIRGSTHLSVYYVHLGNDKEESRTSWQEQQGHEQENSNVNKNDTIQDGKIAAHAFCNRCGVHILRAPDSNSDFLEVNMNCLDDIDGKYGNSNASKIKMHVSFDDNKKGMGLGSGHAILNQFNPTEKCDSEEDKDTAGKNVMGSPSLSSAKTVGVRNGPLHTQNDWVSSWKTKTASITDASLPSKSPSNVVLPDTPATSATNGSDSTLSHSSSNEVSSLSNGSSGDGDFSSGNVEVSRDVKPMSIGTWAVASSLQSTKPQAGVILSPTSTQGNTPGARIPPSSVMRDQLKYYMEKHLSSPPSTTKTDASLSQYS